MDTVSREGLPDALAVLRSRVAEARLPLELPSAAAARRDRTQVIDQIDDYLLPRVRSASAPLLAVVGGSTGAGKSTLVNSLLGVEVTAAGVLRPTTHWPVLVHHPLDRRWFSDDRVLPGLARLTVAVPGGAVPDGASPAGVTLGGGESPGARPGLRLVAADSLPQGLALLDTPDIDSVVEQNRTLATQLLGAGDLWLFVTTAARYADAVPWELLEAAARRRVHLALVLDRVDAGTQAPITTHLRQMLDEHGLADAAILLVPEVDPVDGLLPESALTAVADWLTELAIRPASRARAIAQTRDGAAHDVLTRARSIGGALDDQHTADSRLRTAVGAAYDEAVAQVARATSDGSMLRGEVLARWQDVVGTGELFRAVEEKVSWVRDRIVAGLRGRRSAEPALAHAVGHGLEAVVMDAAEEAAERAHAAWRTDPAGAGLLHGLELSRASSDLRPAVAEQIRAWQGDVLELVRTEGAGKRSKARVLSVGVNVLGAALVVAVFASTGGLSGAEVGIAGGAAVLAQRVLEAVFGDDAVRQLTRTAHMGLEERARALLAGQALRFTAQLDALGTADATGDGLRHAADVVARELAAEQASAAADDSVLALEQGPGGLSAGHRGRLRGAGLTAVAAGASTPGASDDLAAAARAPRLTLGRRLRSWWRGNDADDRRGPDGDEGSRGPGGENGSHAPDGDDGPRG